MRRTHAQRARDTMGIAGMCGGRAGVLDSKRTFHLQSGGLNARPTNMFSHLREEDSASGRNEQRRGTPMRHINPPPLCSGVPSIAYWRYRGPKWFESGLANLRSVVRSPGESSPAGKDAAALPRLRAPRWCLRKRQQALSSCALRLAAPAQGAWDSS